MSPMPDGRRPYIRPVTGWWRRNTFFVEYMIHEGTAVFVAAYALVLLIGLVCLSQGEGAWNAWWQALKSPASVVFHSIILVAIAYHSWTWFRILPRTLPVIVVNGKRLSAAAITRSGLAAVVVASLILFGLAWSMGA